jgi:hypothetical protein
MVVTKQNDTPYIKALLSRFLNVTGTMFPKFGIDVIFPWGHMVVQLVEALCSKPEGGGFNSWWCHWNFSLT